MLTSWENHSQIKTKLKNMGLSHFQSKDTSPAPLHGGCFAGSIVSQEGDHLVLMQVQTQFVEGKFAASLVDFSQLVYAHHQWEMTGLLLDAPHLLCSSRRREPYVNTYVVRRSILMIYISSESACNCNHSLPISPRGWQLWVIIWMTDYPHWWRVTLVSARP